MSSTSESESSSEDSVAHWSSFTVDEVRRGLFRIRWNINFAKDDRSFSKEFKVMGSTSYVISCLPKLCSIADSSGRRNRNEWTMRLSLKLLSPEQATPTDPILLNSQRQLLQVWQSKDSENELKLGEQHSGVWTLWTYPAKRLPTDILLWMDFGSSTVGSEIFKKSLTQIFVKQVCCDVKFNFKNEKTVGAHVSVLSAGSSVFATMFESDFREAQTRTVMIEDVQFNVFIHLLTHLYNGDTPKLKSDETIKLVYEAADKYDVVGLKYECVELIVTRIKIANAIKLLIWSHDRSVPKLKEAVLKFITHNALQLCEQTEWLELIKNHPHLSLDVTKSIIWQTKRRDSSVASSDESYDSDSME